MHGAGRKDAGPAMIAAAVLVLVFTAGCTSVPSSPPAGKTTEPGTPADQLQSWMDVPLTDLQGRGIFTVRSLSVQPVLVVVVSESCPSCVILLERQLDEISRLYRVQKGIVTVVVLDLDPGPGPGFVAAHPGALNFTGYTARIPTKEADDLLQTFGPFAVDTAQVPVILVCPGRDGQLLPPGVKTEPVLNTTIISRC